MRNRAENDIRFSYDKKFDVLYISIGSPRESYCEEPEEGVLIRHSLKDGEFTGITIFEFRRRCQEGYLSKLKLPITIDFTNLANCLS